MTRSRLVKLSTTAVVTGVASLAFAAPAVALEVGDPGRGAVAPGGGGAGPSSDDPWMEIAIGALGGLALAGAGVAAANGMRHRQSVSAG